MSDPDPVALDQDLLLIAKIVVERGLGDLQLFGQQAHGRLLIAVLKKQVRRSPQHGISLDEHTPLSCLKSLPRFATVYRRVKCLHNLGSNSVLS